MAFQGAALGKTLCSGAQGDKDTCPRGETQIPSPREGNSVRDVPLSCALLVLEREQAFPKPFVLK